MASVTHPVVIVSLGWEGREGGRQSKRERRLIGHGGSLIVSLDAKCQCESQISASSDIEGKITAH